MKPAKEIAIEWAWAFWMLTVLAYKQVDFTLLEAAVFIAPLTMLVRWYSRWSFYQGLEEGVDMGKALCRVVMDLSDYASKIPLIKTWSRRNEK